MVRLSFYFKRVSLRSFHMHIQWSLIILSCPSFLSHLCLIWKWIFVGSFISHNMLISSSIHFPANSLLSFIMTQLSFMMYVYHIFFISSSIGSHCRQCFKIFGVIHRYCACCPNLCEVVCALLCLECPTFLSLPSTSGPYSVSVPSSTVILHGRKVCM